MEKNLYLLFLGRYGDLMSNGPFTQVEFDESLRSLREEFRVAVENGRITFFKATLEPDGKLAIKEL